MSDSQSLPVPLSLEVREDLEYWRDEANVGLGMHLPTFLFFMDFPAGGRMNII